MVASPDLKRKGYKMSTYPLSELLHLWKRGELTAEQAIGYMLQHLPDFEERLTALQTGRRRTRRK